MRIVGSLATKFAPPFSLVLHYFIGGAALNLIALIVLLLFGSQFAQPFYNLQNAAIVHIQLLGFVMMIIFGALYQLIPVALEVPVFSFRLGYLQFYIYLAGIIIFVISLIYGNLFFLLPVGALLLYISMAIFIFNFFMSLKHLEKFDITSKFLIAANISLFIGISLGIFLSINFFTGWVSDIFRLVVTHIIFTLLGFIPMVVMGVSMVLLPMFSLAHKFNDKYINIAFYLMVIAVFVFGSGFLFTGSNYILVSGIYLILLGMVFYLLQVYEIYSKRPRRTKDIGMDTMFYSHFVLILSVIAGLFIPFMEESVYLFGISLIFGFFPILIYGSMFKIVPFLTWFHRFSNLVGKKKVPMLVDMLPQKIPDIQVVVYSLGFCVLFVGTFLHIPVISILGTVLMLIAVLIFVYLIYYILNFKVED
ncbi:hypothetical protein [Persephonella sp. KM09-Lau-8]|uniref:hypothetical protein n=1 Tax=Persephonella sp. KM09-Lau-8 TaxID=1158345 RepID=UPI0004975D0A|nr:hypothetical protein [Persephonella sp. KM09-Lau-8]